jgi:pyruvate dehydrogenase E2 component (dihydrolipoamide acetyltransferase)
MINAMQRFKRLDGVPEALRKLADQIFPGGRQANDLSQVLARLTVPVLVIWGEHDRILPPAAIGALGPNVRLERIPGAGHMPMMEQAASVNRLLASHAAVAES